jgi:hypothetical protein
VRKGIYLDSSEAALIKPGDVVQLVIPRGDLMQANVTYHVVEKVELDRIPYNEYKIYFYSPDKGGVLGWGYANHFNSVSTETGVLLRLEGKI